MSFNRGPKLVNVFSSLIFWKLSWERTDKIWRSLPNTFKFHIWNMKYIESCEKQNRFEGASCLNCLAEHFPQTAPWYLGNMETESDWNVSLIWVVVGDKLYIQKLLMIACDTSLVDNTTSPEQSCFEGQNGQHVKSV